MVDRSKFANNWRTNGISYFGTGVLISTCIPKKLRVTSDHYTGIPWLSWFSGILLVHDATAIGADE